MATHSDELRPVSAAEAERAMSPSSPETKEKYLPEGYGEGGAGVSVSSAQHRLSPDSYGGGGGGGGGEEKEDREGDESGRFGTIKRHRRPLTHLAVAIVFTGWWIASLVLHRTDMNWVVPFLLWLAIMIRLVTYYIPISYVTRPIQWIWQHTAVRAQSIVPERLRTLVGAAIAIGAVLIGAFVTEETADNTRANRAISLFGLAVILFCFWITSRHRRAVNWRTVIVGMLSQYIVGLFVLRTGVGYDIFRFIADRATDLLGFAKDGVAFLTNPDIATLPMFFFGVVSR